MTELKDQLSLLGRKTEYKQDYAAKEDAKIRFDFGEGTKRRQGPVVELPAHRPRDWGYQVIKRD